MWNILGGVLGPLFNFIAKVGGYLAAFWVGKTHERKKELEGQNKTLKKHQEIDSKKPAKRSDILDKMENDEF